MSCAQTYQIKNPHYKHKGYFNNWKQYIDVPCGWCLNCRVDKQNWITDACEYEWKKYNYIGAFVTFTYDDIHLYDHSNILPDDFFAFVDDSGKEHVIPFIKNKPAQYSLCRQDARDFLKRLRAKINYYYKKLKIKNVDLCRKDFAFIQCGEYGDLFGRPHYHFVFFGLDYDFCKDIFEDCWQQGLIDSLPIEDGAFSYVSKYFTKQLIGKRAVEVYDNNNLERPYFTHSLGFGKGIILEQLDYIKSHNCCYLNKNDVLRPIPIYYRNCLHLRALDNKTKQTQSDMIQHKIKPNINYRYEVYNNNRYSLRQINEYRKQQSLLRHRKLEIKMANSSIPIEPLITYDTKSNSDISNLVDKLFIDSLHNEKGFKPHYYNFDKFCQYCDENKIIPF